VNKGSFMISAEQLNEPEISAETKYFAFLLPNITAIICHPTPLSQPESQPVFLLRYLFSSKLLICVFS